jgi:hypothetical protein
VKYFESENLVQILSEEKRIHIDGEPVILDDMISVSMKTSALRILKSSYNNRIRIGRQLR